MTTASLSRRQRQVCDLVCQGRSNKEIARMLEISPRTVEDHRLEVYVKMDVPNSTALVHKVLSARIVELEMVHRASEAAAPVVGHQA